MQSETLQQVLAILAQLPQRVEALLGRPLNEMQFGMLCGAGLGGLIFVFLVLKSMLGFGRGRQKPQKTPRRQRREDLSFELTPAPAVTVAPLSEDACRTALMYVSRDHRPGEWAAAQHDLGLALSRTGDSDASAAGLQKLRHAEEAFRLALRVRTADKAPAEHAETQAGLDAVLRRIEARQAGE